MRCFIRQPPNATYRAWDAHKHSAIAGRIGQIHSRPIFLISNDFSDGFGVKTVGDFQAC
jgi:hypothetical protein